MSDLIDGNDGAGAEKHGQARSLVDAALRARQAGEDDRADLLMEQARRTDPQAVEDALMEAMPNVLTADERDLASGRASDEEVAAISRTVQPHAAAPSRAGITGPGSGADGEDG